MGIIQLLFRGIPSAGQDLADPKNDLVNDLNEPQPGISYKRQKASFPFFLLLILSIYFTLVVVNSLKWGFSSNRFWVTDNVASIFQGARLLAQRSYRPRNA